MFLVAVTLGGRLPAQRAPSSFADERAHVRDTVFVENRGQWQTSARFVARAGSSTIALKGDAIELVEVRSRRGACIRLRFAGARASALEGEERVSTRYNYFLGKEAVRWQSGVPGYRSIVYRGLYDGIDLRVRQGVVTTAAYDLLIEPGARVEDVEVDCEGADTVSIAADGSLIIEVGEFTLRQTPPRSWEVLPDGSHRDVPSTFVQRGSKQYGFQVDERVPGRPLVVDPGLVWSTFVGGTGALTGEGAYAVAVDERGAVTIGGLTGDITFPVTPGAFDETYAGGGGSFPSDAFVAQLDGTGERLVFATFLGGALNDEVRSLDWSESGILCLFGQTVSQDFPLTPNAIDTTTVSDDFVTCLDQSGSNLVFSTFLGGSSGEGSVTGNSPGGVLEGGIATIAGVTNSRDFPTTQDALYPRHSGEADAYLAQIDIVEGELLYSTFFGGSDSEGARDVWVQGSRVAITGTSQSRDLPLTANAFQSENNGSDAFVTVLDLDTNTLVYSSFLGSAEADRGRAVHLDANGIVTIAGDTDFDLDGSTFPATPGAFLTEQTGLTSAFVTRMDTADGSLLYSTFLGGIWFNESSDLVVQSSGAATVVGITSARDFPVTAGAFKTTNLLNFFDAFVTRIRPDGSGLIYSTYLGGPDGKKEGSFHIGLGLDSTGAATVVGDTQSPDFPISEGAFQSELGGFGDVFVSRLDMLPTGVARLGSSSPGCAGPLAIGVWNSPAVGANDFAIDCTDAPPSTTRGLLLFSFGAAETPINVKGVDLWLDPGQLLAVLPVGSDEVGYRAVPLRVPDDPAAAGAVVYAQFVWWDPCAPGGRSASPALAIAIQP